MILDPHIKISDTYFVHNEGMRLQLSGSQKTNIFVRANDRSPEPFVGKCWPGLSNWIDFLNEDAQQFWSDLHSTTNFVGSNHLYLVWNDMNEPSVFETESKTIPL